MALIPPSGPVQPIAWQNAPQDRQRKRDRSAPTRPSRLEARTSASPNAGPSACRRPRTPAPAASRPAARRAASAPPRRRPERRPGAPAPRRPGPEPPSPGPPPAAAAADRTPTRPPRQRLRRAVPRDVAAPHLAPLDPASRVAARVPADRRRMRRRLVLGKALRTVRRVRMAVHPAPFALVSHDTHSCVCLMQRAAGRLARSWSDAPAPESAGEKRGCQKIGMHPTGGCIPNLLTAMIRWRCRTIVPSRKQGCQTFSNSGQAGPLGLDQTIWATPNTGSPFRARRQSCRGDPAGDVPFPRPAPRRRRPRPGADVPRPPEPGRAGGRRDEGRCRHRPHAGHRRQLPSRGVRQGERPDLPRHRGQLVAHLRAQPQDRRHAPAAARAAEGAKDRRRRQRPAGPGLPVRPLKPGHDAAEGVPRAAPGRAGTKEDRRRAHADAQPRPQDRRRRRPSRRRRPLRHLRGQRAAPSRRAGRAPGSRPRSRPACAGVSRRSGTRAQRSSRRPAGSCCATRPGFPTGPGSGSPGTTPSSTRGSPGAGRRSGCRPRSPASTVAPRRRSSSSLGPTSPSSRRRAAAPLRRPGRARARQQRERGETPLGARPQGQPGAAHAAGRVRAGGGPERPLPVQGGGGVTRRRPCAAAAGGPPLPLPARCCASSTACS